MLKFLRKYNKFIMVVGGSLLMVVFLLPQAPKLFGAGGLGGTYARFDGGRISRAAYTDASRELEMLGNMVSEALLVRLGITGVDHWHLLTHEAERLGLVGGPDDGRAFIQALGQELAPLFATDQPGAVQLIENNRADLINAGNPADAIDRVLAKLRGVSRLGHVYIAPALLSRVETAAHAGDSYDTTVADIALIRASVGSPGDAPSEAAMQEHFEAYKDVRPEENEFGIGYLRPDAVRVEFMKIDAVRTASQAPIDEEELVRFFRRAPDRYGRDIIGNRDAVVRDYQREQAAEFVEEAAEAVGLALLKSKRGLTGDQRYLSLPADWASRRLSMDALAEAAKAKLPATPDNAPPLAYASEPDDAFKDRAALDAMSGVGRARLGAPPPQQAPDARPTFAALALGVRELAGENDLRVQVGLTFGPIYDFQQNAYFVRILEARPESPPESIEEVRTRVRINTAKLADYERLSSPESLEALRELALAEGLQALADQRGAQLYQSVNVSLNSMGMMIPDLTMQDINTPEVRAAVAGLTDGWAAELVATTVPAADRTTTAASPSTLGVVVAQVTAWRPLNLENFRTQVGAIEMRLRSRLYESTAGQGGLSLPGLTERLNLRYVGRDREEEAAAAEAEAAGEGADGAE